MYIKLFYPRYSLATISSCHNIPLVCFSVNKSMWNLPGGTFWHKQIIEKLYRGYRLATTLIIKLYWGYVLAMYFICQKIPPVYLCVVEYVCLLHWSDGFGRLADCYFTAWSTHCTISTTFKICDFFYFKGRNLWWQMLKSPFLPWRFITVLWFRKCQHISAGTFLFVFGDNMCHYSPQ